MQPLVDKFQGQISGMQPMNIVCLDHQNRIAFPIESKEGVKG